MSSIMTFMGNGGFLTWAIAGVWGAGLVLCVERYFRFTAWKTQDGLELMNTVRELVKKNKHQEALNTCEASGSLMGEVMKDILTHADESTDSIEEAYHSSMRQMVPKLQTGMSYVAKSFNASTSLVVVGTLHGLLITVVNIARPELIKSFASYPGTTVALSTTALGVAAAFSLLGIHNALIRKGNGIIAQVEGNGMMLVEVLSEKKSSHYSMDKKAA
jgi:biopolymer transport protein ExbB/TolQ